MYPRAVSVDSGVCLELVSGRVGSVDSACSLIPTEDCLAGLRRRSVPSEVHLPYHQVLLYVTSFFFSVTLLEYCEHVGLHFCTLILASSNWVFSVCALHWLSYHNRSSNFVRVCLAFASFCFVSCRLLTQLDEEILGKIVVLCIYYSTHPTWTRSFLPPDRTFSTNFHS